MLKHAAGKVKDLDQRYWCEKGPLHIVGCVKIKDGFVADYAISWRRTSMEGVNDAASLRVLENPAGSRGVETYVVKTQWEYPPQQN